MLIRKYFPCLIFILFFPVAFFIMQIPFKSQTDGLFPVLIIGLLITLVIGVIAENEKKQILKFYLNFFVALFMELPAAGGVFLILDGYILNDVLWYKHVLIGLMAIGLFFEEACKTQKIWLKVISRKD